MIKSTNEIDAESLHLLMGRFVTDPEQQKKLSDFEFGEGLLKGKYAGIPVELEVRVTPKG